MGSLEKTDGRALTRQSRWRIFQPLIGRGDLVPLVIEDLSSGCARAIDSFFLNGNRVKSSVPRGSCQPSLSRHLHFIREHFSPGQRHALRARDGKHAAKIFLLCSVCSRILRPSHHRAITADCVCFVFSREKLSFIGCTGVCCSSNL